jgi:hypothetical protein
MKNISILTNLSVVSERKRNEYEDHFEAVETAFNKMKEKDQVTIVDSGELNCKLNYSNSKVESSETIELKESSLHIDQIHQQLVDAASALKSR